jgi:hypothetical protein
MPASPADEKTVRINMHVIIDVDPAKWPASESDEPDTATVVKTLIAGGIDKSLAESMAARMAAPAGGIGNAVRAEIRKYALDAIAGSEKMIAAGATVKFYERPNKA